MALRQAPLYPRVQLSSSAVCDPISACLEHIERLDLLCGLQSSPQQRKVDVMAAQVVLDEVDVHPELRKDDHFRQGGVQHPATCVPCHLYMPTKPP